MRIFFFHSLSHSSYPRGARITDTRTTLCWVRNMLVKRSCNIQAATLKRWQDEASPTLSTYPVCMAGVAELRLSAHPT